MVGAFDGAVYIWYPEKEKGARFHEIKDHRTLVQGVAMDPLNSMIVTQAADKSVRIYKKSKKGRRLFCAHHIRVRETDTEVDKKSLVAIASDSDQQDEQDEDSRKYFQHHYFLDDSAPTFFRRASWSPEGNFLLLPCGQSFDSPTQTDPQNVTWVFTRAGLGHGAACCIPSNDITIATRFSPILYKSGPAPSSSAPSTSESTTNITLDDHGNAMPGIEPTQPEAVAPSFKLFDINYKLVFAVASLSSVYIYDTEHEHPIAALQDAHYSKLTDLSWSEDGKVLAISSTDGYISLVYFDDGELGEVLDDAARAEIMKPAMEARIPKPPEPRKPKIASAAVASASPSTAMESAQISSHGHEEAENAKNEENTKMQVAGEEDDDEDDEDEDDEAVEGTVLNFDEPTAIETEKKPSAPVVRKEGRRVVTTVVTAELPAPATQSGPTEPNATSSSSMDQDTPATH